MRRPALISLALVALACGSTSPPPPLIFDCTKDDCRDCGVLGTKLAWDAATAQLCQACQGADAGANPDCFNFPTEGSKVVVRGCNTDSDCPPLSTFCGHYTGQPHNTCVVSDAK